MKKAILSIIIIISVALGITQREEIAGFATRGFSTLPSTTATDVTYTFGAVNIYTERIGAASGSGGFELGKFLPTSATAFTVASASTGFAVTMNQSGRIKGCSFDLQTIPTSGTVSVMIQKNATLQSGKYCKLPSASTFATNGGLDDVSVNETFLEDNITFVAGDRIGLIASSSGLNADTFDGLINLIVQITN